MNDSVFVRANGILLRLVAQAVNDKTITMEEFRDVAKMMETLISVYQVALQIVEDAEAKVTKH